MPGVGEDRAALWLLVALFAVAFAIAWSAVGKPPTAEEATWELAARSLARDGDFLFTFEDEERLRAWPSEAEVRPHLLLTGGQMRFAVPRPYALLLAPFAGLAPESGSLLLNTLLLAVLLIVAYRSLDRVADSSPAWLVPAAVFGSVVAVYLRTSLPTLFLATATAAAIALLALDAPIVGRRLRDMYPQEPPVASSVARWGLAGALLALVALHHPLLLLLLLAPVAFAPRRRLPIAVAAAALGCAAVLFVPWWAGELWGHLGLGPPGSEPVRLSVASSPAVIERASLDSGGESQWRLSIEHPTLAMWNGVYALVGRHVGVLPYLPLLPWLLVGATRTGRRQVLLLAAVAALVTNVVWSPFDFAFLPAAIGPRLLVPFFVALWWLPPKLPGRGGGVTALVVGLALLWPYWTPAAAPLAAAESGRLGTGLLASLPYETTQRHLPAGGEIVTRDLFVRALSGLEPGGRASQLRLLSGGRGELLVAAARLDTLELRFGATVGTDLRAAGWEVQETMLAPDGAVAFTLRPEGRGRRHPTWWSREAQDVRLVRFELPAPAGTSLSVASRSGDAVE